MMEIYWPTGSKFLLLNLIPLVNLLNSYLNQNHYLLAIFVVHFKTLSTCVREITVNQSCRVQITDISYCVGCDRGNKTEVHDTAPSTASSTTSSTATAIAILAVNPADVAIAEEKGSHSSITTAVSQWRVQALWERGLGEAGVILNEGRKQPGESGWLAHSVWGGTYGRVVASLGFPSRAGVNPLASAERAITDSVGQWFISQLLPSRYNDDWNERQVHISCH